MPDCVRLASPRVVAIARDTYLTPRTPFADSVHLPAGNVPMYGQDLSTSIGRAAPKGQSVGRTPAELKPKMEKLLSIFAAGDRSGMARRLFDTFLRKRTTPSYFDDGALNLAAGAHKNIEYFCNVALSGPPTPPPPGKKRIHQALKEAGWDIKKLISPADLGVPAFNDGNKAFSTGDFDNGLGLMINGVQHAYVMAQSYAYDPKAKRYCMGVKYVFYDVFGLDDDDLKEFGTGSDGMTSSSSAVGITAWWQLQHQHGYAPLVTRIVIEKTYDVSAT